VIEGRKYARESNQAKVALADVPGATASLRPHNLAIMNRLWLALLLAPLLLAGCARNYVMSLNNGARVTTRGKPKLEGGAYVYKDIRGEISRVPAGRVTEIAPASLAKDRSRKFKPPRGR
jgi:hypothetical protein